jgi:hypothetical protein
VANSFWLDRTALSVWISALTARWLRASRSSSGSAGVAGPAFLHGGGQRFDLLRPGVVGGFDLGDLHRGFDQPVRAMTIDEVLVDLLGCHEVAGHVTDSP